MTLQTSITLPIHLAKCGQENRQELEVYSNVNVTMFICQPEYIQNELDATSMP